MPLVKGRERRLSHTLIARGEYDSDTLRARVVLKFLSPTTGEVAAHECIDTGAMVDAIGELTSLVQDLDRAVHAAGERQRRAQQDRANTTEGAYMGIRTDDLPAGP